MILNIDRKFDFGTGQMCQNQIYLTQSTPKAILVKPNNLKAISKASLSVN